MSAGDAVVVWLAVAKQGHQWRNGGVAGGTWLLLEGQEAVAWRGTSKTARGLRTVAASGQHGVVMAVKWRLMSMTQSGRVEVFPLRLVSMSQSDRVRRRPRW
jgi:hypothetical protein